MVLLSTLLSTHRRSLVFACILLLCLLYLGILPTTNPSSQLNTSGGYFDRNNGEGFNVLSDDRDYHLEALQKHLSPKQQQQQQQQQQTSVFTRDMFAAITSQYEEDSSLKPLSVVILRKSSRPSAIERLVQQIVRYPFFKEIFIYNTDWQRPISKAEFIVPDDDSVKLQVINVSKNDRLNTLSRYTLCASMASYEYCYFQDDDAYGDTEHDPASLPSTYWDTLYINFLRYPSLIHANVQSSRFMDHYRWRFHNREIKMHSGYIDLAFGAIVPRWKVQHFLTQLGKSGLGKDRLYEADAYFSIWSNQYPWLLDNPLRNSLSASTPAFDINEMPTILLDPNPHIGDTRRMIYDAARRLHRTLQSDLTPNPKDYVDRLEEMPPMHQRDTRSSCANDRCLFITNIDPVSPEQLDTVPSFDKAKYTNPKDWDQVLEENLDLPTNDYWMRYGYHNAVDQRNDTCWSMKTNPRTNDYFGLIALGSGLPSQFVISTTAFAALPSEPIDQLLKISVLHNVYDWSPCKITHYSTSSNPINDNKSTIITDMNFELDCLPSVPTFDQGSNFINDRYRLQKIHTIRASFLKDLEIPFTVCGLTINHFNV